MQTRHKIISVPLYVYELRRFPETSYGALLRSIYGHSEPVLMVLRCVNGCSKQPHWNRTVKSRQETERRGGYRDNGAYFLTVSHGREPKSCTHTVFTFLTSHTAGQSRCEVCVCVNVLVCFRKLQNTEYFMPTLSVDILLWSYVSYHNKSEVG